jgi:hypothetical protein
LVLICAFQAKQHIFKWEGLIYTNEIGKVAKTVEDMHAIREYNDEESHFAAVNERKYATFFNRASNELELPSFSLPYYEGFNRYESRTWLGLYRRDEEFSIELLLDVVHCA